MPNHFCLGQLAALEEAQDLVEERKWLPTSVSSGCCGPMSRFGFMAARHRCGTVEGDDFLRVASWRGLRNKRMQAPVFGHVPSSRDVSDDACSKCGHFNDAVGHHHAACPRNAVEEGRSECAQPLPVTFYSGTWRPRPPTSRCP